MARKTRPTGQAQSQAQSHSGEGQVASVSGLWRKFGAERLAALILLAVSVGLLLTSLQYGLMLDGTPGPGLFPALIAGALVVLSLAWLIVGRRSPATPAPVLPAATDDLMEDEEVHIDRAGRRRIAFVVVWTLIPLFLMEHLGYTITMTAYVGGLLFAIARVRPWLAALTSAVGAVATHAGASLIGVNLPDPFGLLQLIGL